MFTLWDICKEERLISKFILRDSNLTTINTSPNPPPPSLPSLRWPCTFLPTQPSLTYSPFSPFSLFHITYEGAYLLIKEYGEYETKIISKAKRSPAHCQEVLKGWEKLSLLPLHVLLRGLIIKLALRQINSRKKQI